MALFPLKAARTPSPRHAARFSGLRAAARRTARALSLIRGARALIVEVEIATPAEVAERLEDLAAARREAEGLRARVAFCEARIADLEGEVAASGLVAMDLRARLVCLHGKLATAAATTRYQSFSRALQARTREA